MSVDWIENKPQFVRGINASWRFMAQINIGGLPYDEVAELIDLFATEVAPMVRREAAKP